MSRADEAALCIGFLDDYPDRRTPIQTGTFRAVMPETDSLQTLRTSCSSGFTCGELFSPVAVVSDARSEVAFLVEPELGGMTDPGTAQCEANAKSGSCSGNPAAYSVLLVSASVRRCQRLCAPTDAPASLPSGETPHSHGAAGADSPGGVAAHCSHTDAFDG